MPNKKSAKKDLRKSAKRQRANNNQKSSLKQLIKTSVKKVQAQDKGVKEDLPKLIKALDKAAKNGIIKKNTASRKKSKLTKKINTLK